MSLSKVIRDDQADYPSWVLPDMQAGSSSGQGLLTAGKIEALSEQARQEGFQQGLEEGRAAGAADIQKRIQQLENMLDTLREPLRELDETVEEQLVQLAMVVARQLVRRELKADPGQVIAVVKAALATLPIASRHIKLVLHPDDAELVREALSVHDTEQAVKIMEDPVQTRGGCHVVTETSTIDATVESRMNAVIASVLGGERRSDRGKE